MLPRECNQTQDRGVLGLGPVGVRGKVVRQVGASEAGDGVDLEVEGGWLKLWL